MVVTDADFMIEVYNYLARKTVTKEICSRMNDRHSFKDEADIYQRLVYIIQCTTKASYDEGLGERVQKARDLKPSKERSNAY